MKHINQFRAAKKRDLGNLGRRTERKKHLVDGLFVLIKEKRRRLNENIQATISIVRSEKEDIITYSIIFSQPCSLRQTAKVKATKLQLLEKEKSRK